MYSYTAQKQIAKRIPYPLDLELGPRKSLNRRTRTMASTTFLITLTIVGSLVCLTSLVALYKAIREWTNLCTENKHRLRPRLRESSKKRKWVLPVMISLKILVLLAVIFGINWAKILAHNSKLMGVLYVSWMLIVGISLFLMIPPSFTCNLKSRILPPTVIGLCFFLLMSVSMIWYGALTLKGDNVSQSLEYQGPARIVGHETHYDDQPVSATLTVAYGGSWACSNNPESYCEVPIELSWCDYYDSTGYWASASYGASGRSWRELENRDIWNGYFTCANGFFNQENNEDNDANEDGSTYFNEEDRTFDPNEAPQLDDNWPWLVNIFADCSCTEGTVDTRVTRDWVYRVERFQVGMSIGAAGGLLSALLVTILWCCRSARSEDEVDQKDFVLVAGETTSS